MSQRWSPQGTGPCVLGQATGQFESPVCDFQSLWSETKIISVLLSPIVLSGFRNLSTFHKTLGLRETQCCSSGSDPLLPITTHTQPMRSVLLRSGRNFKSRVLGWVFWSRGPFCLLSLECRIFLCQALLLCCAVCPTPNSNGDN